MKTPLFLLRPSRVYGGGVAVYIDGVYWMSFRDSFEATPRIRMWCITHLVEFRSDRIQEGR